MTVENVIPILHACSRKQSQPLTFWALGGHRLREMGGLRRLIYLTWLAGDQPTESTVTPPGKVVIK